MKIQLLRPKKINDGFAVTGQKLEGSVGRKFFFFFFFLVPNPYQYYRMTLILHQVRQKKKKRKEKKIQDRAKIGSVGLLETRYFFSRPYRILALWAVN